MKSLHRCQHIPPVLVLYCIHIFRHFQEIVDIHVPKIERVRYVTGTLFTAGTAFCHHHLRPHYHPYTRYHPRTFLLPSLLFHFRSREHYPRPHYADQPLQYPLPHHCRSYRQGCYQPPRTLSCTTRKTFQDGALVPRPRDSLPPPSSRRHGISDFSSRRWSHCSCHLSDKKHNARTQVVGVPLTDVLSVLKPHVELLADGHFEPSPCHYLMGRTSFVQPSGKSQNRVLHPFRRFS